MPDVAPLPALANGCMTFGYFGRTVRLNDVVLAAWARILHAVPGSRLMLNSAPFGEPAGREQMAARFAALGIDAARLELVYTSPQPRTWAAYGEIDIALDPFPHNAGTTTIEALVAGRSGRDARRPPDGRTVRRRDPARGRTGRLDHRRCRRVRGAGRRGASGSSTRWRAAGGTASALRRVAAARCRRIWRARSRRRIARCGDAGATTTGEDVRQLYAAGDADGAGRLAERLLARDPRDAAALHVTWPDQVQSGRRRRRRWRCCSVRSMPRRMRRPVGSRRDAALERAFGRKPRAAYRQALQLDPALVPALGNLGNVLLDLHRVAEARNVLAEALRRAPDQPVAAAQSGAEPDGMRRSGSRRGDARGRRWRFDPDDAEVHETLGALLGQSGRPIEAESASSRRIAAGGSSGTACSPIWRSRCRRRAGMPRPRIAAARRWQCGRTMPSRTATCCSRSTTATT